MLYGSKCHYKFYEFLKGYNNIITFKDANCIELIIGDERKKDPEYDRYYDAYLCEVMDRDKYERRTKTGQLRKLKKKIHKLKEEKDDLSGRLDAAAEIASAEVRKRQKAEETIEEMKAGFRELERVFGDLPPEIVSLYRIPDRKG